MEKAKKLIMITGFNKGIGFAVAKHLLKTQPDYQFLLCARSLERGTEAVEQLKKEVPDVESRVTMRSLDISNSKNIDEFIDWIKTTSTQVDCLFNNAGALVKTTEVNEEAVKGQLPTNYYGTVELTNKMFPLMPEGSKIICMTSTLGTYKLLPDCTLREKLEKPGLTRQELTKIVDEFCDEVKAKKFPVKSGKYPVYGFSKLALNVYVRILANEKEIIDKKIQVYACHPGVVQTEMGGPDAPYTIEQGIVSPCYVINLPWKVDEKYQGKLFADCKVTSLD